MWQTTCRNDGGIWCQVVTSGKLASPDPPSGCQASQPSSPSQSQYQFIDPGGMDGLVDCGHPGIWTRACLTRGAVKWDGTWPNTFGLADRLAWAVTIENETFSQRLMPIILSFEGMGDRGLLRQKTRRFVKYHCLKPVVLSQYQNGDQYYWTAVLGRYSLKVVNYWLVINKSK